MATTEGPRVPITGPRATTHEGARALTRVASDALDGVNSATRGAETKNPETVDVDYRAKAAGKRWIGPNAFDSLSGGRTTD